MTTFRNIFLVVKDQLPLSRAWKNFVVTKNAWGLFHKNSHISSMSGQPKVKYGSKKSAEKAALSMAAKKKVHFSNYKCLFCDGYHIGKNSNKL